MFTEAERAVFCYHDGARAVHADPLVLRRRLVRAARGELDDLIEAAFPAEAGGAAAGPAAELARADAQERLAAAAREAFGLPPVDPETGGGAPEAVCWRLLTEFLEWLEKNARPGGS